MENNNELVSVLQELKEENAAQRKLLEKQCRITQGLGALLLCLVVIVALFLFILLPKITTTLDQLNVVVANTQEITEDLKAADIEGTIHSFSLTLEKMKAMDIDTLNQAINDLYQVVNPLSSLFSR